MFCFDTDVLSAALLPRPPLHLLRRLARTPVADQCTTAIPVGEIVYGGARIGRSGHAERMHELLNALHSVVAFDEAAAIEQHVGVKLHARCQRLRLAIRLHGLAIQ